MNAPPAGRAWVGRDPPRLVLLDLDGTLVDTLPDIAFCVSRMLTDLGYEACGDDDVRRWVGNGAEMLVRRAIAETMGDEGDQALIERALARFVELYARHTSERSRVYPGVLEGLEFMRRTGIELACITNKPGRHTEKLLEALGLRHRFSLVLSGDSLSRRKPDPLPIVHAAEQLGVARADTLLVGDSVNDVRAARSAGIRVVCVSYGYNHGEDIRAAGADAVIDSFAELPALLAGGGDIGRQGGSTNRDSHRHRES